MTFTAEQIKELDAPLKMANVKERSQGSFKLSYIEGWQALAEANRIFGHGEWCRETNEIKCVAERERTVGQGKGWGVTYIAKVRVIVQAGDDEVVREGCGTGHGIDRDLGQAHESAIKEAETDATKRALMTFGWPFGLALYDKSREHVSNEATPTNGAAKDTVADLIEELKQTKEEAELAKWGMDNAERIGNAIGVKARVKEAYISHMSKLKGGSPRDATPYKDMGTST